MKKEREIILLRNSLGEAIVKDAASIGMLTAAIAIGVSLESTALQWIAGVLWITTGISAVFQRNRYSLEEARALLDKLTEEDAK